MDSTGDKQTHIHIAIMDINVPSIRRLTRECRCDNFCSAIRIRRDETLKHNEKYTLKEVSFDEEQLNKY